MFVYLKAGCVVFKHRGHVALKTAECLGQEGRRWGTKNVIYSGCQVGQKVPPADRQVDGTCRTDTSSHSPPDSSPWQKRAGAPSSHTACPRPPRSYSGCPERPWWGGWGEVSPSHVLDPLRAEQLHPTSDTTRSVRRKEDNLKKK